MNGFDLSTLSGVYVGSTQYSSIYLGSTQIWSATPVVLPYDAELEYLEASGSQCINTGVINDSSVVIDIKTSMEGKNCLSGTELNTSNRFKWGTNSDGKLYFGYGGTNNVKNSITPTANSPFTFHLEQGASYVKDSSDTTIMSTSASISSYSTYPILLFRVRSGSTLNNYSGTLRVYYCNITGNNVSMRLIPVRVGQVGYLYDKVSGQLFGNVSSGSFILGPDKT